MAQLFINIIGHNASGKTTLAKRLEADLQVNRLTGDDFKEFIRDHIRYFNDLDLSYPSAIGVELRPLTIAYRLRLAQILLQAGQSLIFDGSGFNKVDREPMRNLLADFPAVKSVIIHASIPEDELLQRLEARGKHWADMYHDLRRTSFEPPTSDEADLVLEYDQRNYEEIKKKIERLLYRIYKTST